MTYVMPVVVSIVATWLACPRLPFLSCNTLAILASLVCLRGSWFALACTRSAMGYSLRS